MNNSTWLPKTIASICLTAKQEQKRFVAVNFVLSGTCIFRGGIVVANKFCEFRKRDVLCEFVFRGPWNACFNGKKELISRGINRNIK